MRSISRATALAAALSVLILALGAFAPLQAMAGTVPLTWTLPTKWTDGASITTPITIRVYRATTQAGLAAAPVLATTAAGATTYTDATAPVGSVWYQVSAVVNGVESARTTAVTVTVPQPTPETPTNLQATVQLADTNAYKQRVATDSFSLVAFGSVPVGTPLDTTRTVSDSTGIYCAVKRSAVTPRSRFEPLPPVAFAKCG